MTLVNWAYIGPTLETAFLASLVEFIEALTVVLAVGTVRGWRSASAGAGAGAGTLALLIVIALLGPALTRIPLGSIQVVVGVLLLLFGMRWIHKAILRATGILVMHDEDAIYAQYGQTMRKIGRGSSK